MRRPNDRAGPNHVCPCRLSQADLPSASGRMLKRRQRHGQRRASRNAVSYTHLRAHETSAHL
eukprot:1210899-Alexandrium_andersonii.AAC.1